MMPTTSYHCFVSLPWPKRLPMALLPGQAFSAKAWLTSTRGGSAAVARVEEAALEQRHAEVAK